MLSIAALTRAPDILTPVASSPRSFNISWRPIPEADRRGVIRHYIAKCWAVDFIDLPEKVITIPSSAVLGHDNLYSAEFAGLEENTRYKCDVAAFTVQEGPSDTFDYVTSEDGKNDFKFC